MPFKYAEKIDSIAIEFNKELEENQKWLKLNQDYKSEVAEKKFKENMVGVVNKYLQKVTSLNTEIVNSQKSLTKDKNVKLYPNLMSENNKTSGEMQRSEARNLLQKENADEEILSEIKTNLELNRFDFVSTLIENISSNMPDANTSDYELRKDFLNEVTRLKDEYYKSLGLTEINEKLADRDKAFSKGQRFDFLLKNQKLTQSFDNIFLPDKDSEDYSDQMLYHKQVEQMEMSA